MKKITLLFFIFHFHFLSFGQCPTDDLILTSQLEIDNFAVNYPNCSVLAHELKIDGENSDITNLNGLSSITNAQDVFIRGTQIEDFSGLNNLVTISHLSLWFNQNIQNLEGLASIQTLGELEVFVNNSLTSLSGLDDLQSLDRLNLFENSSLEDITQLYFLESINSLNISGNSLNTLTGLENLLTIQGDLVVSNEPLQDLNEFSNLQTIGGSLYILSNDQVQDLSAFNNIESLENLYIIDCPNLLDSYSLENLQTINGKLRIGFNSGLVTLNIFRFLTSVGDLDVYENDNLESLKGLENLLEINQRLFINNNNSLNSIYAINDVLPSETNEVIILSNSNLSICNNQYICDIVDDPNVSKVIQNNAIGCNTILEVEMSCLLSIGDLVLDNQLKVYPNPVSELLTISLSENLSFKYANIYTILGEKLIETSGKKIDFSSYASGIYFAEIETNKGKVTKKIVKE